jgi:drug/metabolite transporter (DMT)-like permease
MSIDRRSDAALAHWALVGAAFLFGTTFVVVKDAVASAGPVPFLAVRFLIGAAVVWPLAVRQPRGRPGLTRAGVICGAVLCAGYIFQTVGLQYTSSSVSAFITYLLVLIVPLLSAVVLRRPPTAPTIAGIVLAAVGLYLLNGATPSLGKGELLTLGCAVCFAVHIVLLAEFAPRHDSVRLNAVQLTAVGAICLVPGFFTGGYAFPLSVWLAAVYTGIAASAVAFGLMVWAQRCVGPSRTALLLMLEPVFAAVAGAIAGDHLGLVGVAGAALILGGVLVAELRRPPVVTIREHERSDGERSTPSSLGKSASP